jgi:hypothetical protein
VEHIGALVEPGGHGAGVLERQDGPFDFVWWARQVVESTDTIDQSMLPWASASARTAAKSLSHVPSADYMLRRTRLGPPGGDLAGVDDVAGQVAQLEVVVL